MHDDRTALRDWLDAVPTPACYWSETLTSRSLKDNKQMPLDDTVTYQITTTTFPVTFDIIWAAKTGRIPYGAI